MKTFSFSRMAVLAMMMLLSLFSIPAFAAEIKLGNNPATRSNLKQLVVGANGSQTTWLDLFAEFSDAASQPHCEPYDSWKPGIALVMSGAKQGTTCYTAKLDVTPNPVTGVCDVSTEAFNPNEVWGPDIASPPATGNGCKTKVNGLDYTALTTSVSISMDTPGTQPSIQVNLGAGVVCTGGVSSAEPPPVGVNLIVIYFGLKDARVKTWLNNRRANGIFQDTTVLHTLNSVSCTGPSRPR